MGSDPVSAYCRETGLFRRSVVARGVPDKRQVKAWAMATANNKTTKVVARTMSLLDPLAKNVNQAGPSKMTVLLCHADIKGVVFVVAELEIALEAERCMYVLVGETKQT